MFSYIVLLFIRILMLSIRVPILHTYMYVVSINNTYMYVICIERVCCLLVCYMYRESALFIGTPSATLA